ncbi:hypothetical protein QTP88_007890 [Uroleucon formosanum]
MFLESKSMPNILMEFFIGRGILFIYMVVLTIFLLLVKKNILKSSANRVHITGGCITSGISLIANKNSDTESVDPCGTPFF